MNSVYGLDCLTANYSQFWLCRFRSGNIKAATHTGNPIVEKNVKIMNNVESERHVRSVYIALELKIAFKPFGNI